MDCAGHGSHVAGIIGASDEVVMGVAPKGTIDKKCNDVMFSPLLFVTNKITLYVVYGF
jgi:hypothetical protein